MRAVSIQDIVGFGKCSTTMALPIISSMGIETSIIPTGVFSSHTYELGNPAYIELTEIFDGFIEHWKKLNIKFDAIYVGYLGSKCLIDKTQKFIDNFKLDNTILLIDPAMADNGKMYSKLDNNYVEKVKNLCKNADIITPNITEAILLSNKSINQKYYNEKIIEELIYSIVKLGIKNIIITGIPIDDRTLATAVFENNKNNIDYIYNEKIEGYFHGTGDMFSSIIIGSILNNLNLKDSVILATNFIKESIINTSKYYRDNRYGLYFEPILYKLNNILNK